MSLFIGMLAFTDAERAAEIRIGVLLGSLASALVGYLVLRASPARRKPSRLTRRLRPMQSMASPRRRERGVSRRRSAI